MQAAPHVHDSCVPCKQHMKPASVSSHNMCCSSASTCALLSCPGPRAAASTGPEASAPEGRRVGVGVGLPALLLQRAHRVPEHALALRCWEALLRGRAHCRNAHRSHFCTPPYGNFLRPLFAAGHLRPSRACMWVCSSHHRTCVAALLLKHAHAPIAGAWQARPAPQNVTSNGAPQQAWRTEAAPAARLSACAARASARPPRSGTPWAASCPGKRYGRRSRRHMRRLPAGTAGAAAAWPSARRSPAPARPRTCTASYCTSSYVSTPGRLQRSSSLRQLETRAAGRPRPQAVQARQQQQHYSGLQYHAECQTNVIVNEPRSRSTTQTAHRTLT